MVRFYVRWTITAAVLFAALPAQAQVTGSITGIVRDSSAAVLPGATVTVRGPALQRESATATTGPDGQYRVLLLPPGVYEVVVELSGFGTQTRRGVEVAINQQATLDIAMAVAGVSEQVTVASTTPVVDVARSDVAHTVSQRTIDALPLNGRNFTDLVALVPGAKPDPTLTSTTNVEIFGERASAVSYLVDGAENNDPVNGGALVRYTQDSIKEFEVITTGYAAEFGRAQGGVANIVTRSGTDALEGRAFWFTRNDAVDSNNIPAPSPLPAGYTEPEPPALERYQWGGTLGGPIVKNKAFFFGSFEKLNETRGVNFDLTKIPTFVTSGIGTPSHVEDFGIAPKSDGFTGNFKFDVNLNASNRLAAAVDRSTLTNAGLISSPVAGTIAMPSAAASRETPATGALVRETAVLGGSTFLETTANYLRGETGNNLDQSGRSEPLLMLLRSGFIQTGAPFGGSTDQLGKRMQVAQSLSRFIDRSGGGHQLKVGWDFNHISLAASQQVTNDVEYSPAFLAANQADIFTRNFGLYGFQQSAARFFTLSANADGNLDAHISTNDVSLFAQDAWHLNSQLTVNAGLRYDYSSLFGDYKKALAPRAGVAWDVGGRHQTIVKLDYGLFFDRNLLSAAATVPEKGGVFTKAVFDVALPRLGADYTDSLIDYVITSGFPTATGFGPSENALYRQFAADLRSDPLTIYKLLGITVTNAAAAPLITADNIQSLSGKTASQAAAIVNAKYPGTDFRFFDVPGGSIIGNRVLSFFPRGPLDATRIVSRYSGDLVPYTNAFNVGVDQQLPRDISLAVQYVHRRSRDLLTRRVINLFDVPAGNANFGKTTDGGPQISAVTYDGLVDYDGVIVAARKRFTNRYQFGVSYTGSRAKDNLLTGTVGSSFANNNHPELDYGPSNQSAPHIFVANGVVILPFDLNLSGVAFWRSGTAFNPRGLVDSDGDGLVDQRDLTQSRNAFRISAYADVDVRAEKKMFFGRHAASFLVEGFNLLNRANVASVSNVSGPQFGTPIAYQFGREIQFGVRYFLGQGR